MEIGNRKYCSLLFLAPICAVLAGCGGSAEQKAQPKPAIEKVAERGPIRLKVIVDKDRVAVAEPLRLSIDATAPENFEITMPSPGQAFGSLVVKNAKETPSAVVNGTRVWRQEYQLESLVSGEQTIPEMTIHYRESREGAKGREGEGAIATTQTASAGVEGDLSSQPLTIHVVSALKGEVDPADIKHLRDIKGTVDVPLARSWRSVIWIVSAVAAIGALAAILFNRAKHRSEKMAPPVPPGSWAFGQFRRLEEDRLIEQGMYHAFYSRLSDIVRQYIERQFKLMAPERTTEEFLREVRDNPLLREEHQRLLRDFLESADMVKFALYEPGREEAERAFAAARDFVEETAYQDKPEEPVLQTAV